MREIRPSGSEGGVGSIPHPYPYRGGANAPKSMRPSFMQPSAFGQNPFKIAIIKVNKVIRPRFSLSRISRISRFNSLRLGGRLPPVFYFRQRPGQP